jgi:hypothetical protein
MFSAVMPHFSNALGNGLAVHASRTRCIGSDLLQHMAPRVLAQNLGDQAAVLSVIVAF